MFAYNGHDLCRIGWIRKVGYRVHAVSNQVIQGLLLESEEITLSGELGFESGDAIQLTLCSCSNRGWTVLGRHEGVWTRFFKSSEFREGFSPGPGHGREVRNLCYSSHLGFGGNELSRCCSSSLFSRSSVALSFGISHRVLGDLT